MKGKGTFIVTIKDTENASWQGTIQWVDGKKELPFRSMLELIKLVDSAIDGNTTIIKK